MNNTIPEQGQFFTIKCDNPVPMLECTKVEPNVYHFRRVNPYYNGECFTLRPDQWMKSSWIPVDTAPIF